MTADVNSDRPTSHSPASTVLWKRSFIQSTSQTAALSACELERTTPFQHLVQLRPQAPARSATAHSRARCIRSRYAPDHLFITLARCLADWYPFTAEMLHSVRIKRHQRSSPQDACHSEFTATLRLGPGACVIVDWTEKTSAALVIAE